MNSTPWCESYPLPPVEDDLARLTEKILGHCRRGRRVTLLPTTWLTRSDWKRVRSMVVAMGPRSTSP